MTIVNPIMPGLYPDPSICRVDGTYYLVNSTFEYLPGLPIHASEDLQAWRLVGHAIHDARQFDYSGVADSGGMFAPTLRHHDGMFYLVCTQMGAAESSGNFLITAKDVAGPWSRPVMLPDARGIDPSLFFHDGRAWWIGCREVAEQSFPGETEVWMRELDLERGEFVGEESVIWTRTMARAVWAEGPHLYLRDGWFYLATAEGGTSFEHSVMVARSRDLAGPYLPCPRNPVLTHRHLGHGADVQYVGHADLVHDDNDQWWMVMLATRPIDGHHILGRETHLARVTWEDGWPVVNAGLGRLDPAVARSGQWGSRGAPVSGDFLSVRGFASFAENTPEGIILTSTGSAIGSVGHTAALLRRVTSTSSSLSITIDSASAGAISGLVLRQSDAVNVRLEVVASPHGLRVELIRRNGMDEVLGTATLQAGPITLAAGFDDGIVTLSAGTAGQQPTPLESVGFAALSTETAGGFVGSTFGPYVAGPAGECVLFIGWSQEDRA